MSTARERARTWARRAGWRWLGVPTALAVAAAVHPTLSAFSSTTASTCNVFRAGTVHSTDNDSGAAMLALPGATPGASDTSCITVTYAGSLPSQVRLYGTTTGTGLASYLDLTVTRGTGAAGFDNCTGFVADATNYLGLGSGVVYSGTVEGFPDSYAAGVTDPTAGSPATWVTGESHIYRFTVTLQDNDGARLLDAGQVFTWEARNT
jgi:hypothetical protein